MCSGFCSHCPRAILQRLVNVIIARHAIEFAETVKRTFDLGSEERLRSLFEAVGFGEFLMTREAHRFTLPSFDAYFGPFERGGGSTGQVYVGLSEDVRLEIRQELRRSLNDTGGPVHVGVEFGFVSGRR
jgi:hypothetical protein